MLKINWGIVKGVGDTNRFINDTKIILRDHLK